MSETLVCFLVALLSFACGMLAALLIRTIRQEKKAKDRRQTL